MTQVFRYRAARADGSIVRGRVEAIDGAQASSVLAGRGLHPVAVEQAPSDDGVRRGASRRDLAVVFRSISALVTAGVPLERAIASSEAVASGSLRDCLLSCRLELRSGHTLAQGLAAGRGLVPPVVLGMLRAGEHAGRLGPALDQVATQLEQEAELSGRIRQALAYPALLTVAGLVSIGVIAGLVVPRFAELLSELGQELPAATRVLLAASAVVSGHGVVLAGSATPDQARAVVAKLGAVPEVRAAADRLHEFYDYLYDLRYQNGLIDDAEYAATKATHQRYVPFLRDFGQEAGRATPGGKLFNRGSGVRRMEEGQASAAIVDPFEQAAEDAYCTARDVSRQRVMNVVAKIVEQDPAGSAPFIRDVGTNFQAVPAASRAEGRLVATVVRGEHRYFQVVDHDLYESLASVGPQTQGIMERILSAPKRLLQAGVTSLPAFGAANATRDAFFTSLSYAFPTARALGGGAVGAGAGAFLDKENPIRGALRGAALGIGAGVMGTHAQRIAGAMGSILRNDDLYQLWRREGGAGTGFFLQGREDAAKVVTQLRKDGVDASDILSPKSWWDALQTLNRYVEEAPRVAKFRDELRRGASGVQAAAESRDVSLDFSRGGSGRVAQLGRETAAFWNPKIQGLDKLRRVLASPKTYGVGVVAMTAPTIALWSMNKDDAEYWRRPLYERNLFWLVPRGKDERGVTQFLRIPKPFEIGYAFASLPERLLDFAHQRDPERTAAAIRDMVGSIGQGLVPVPTAALPIGEVLIGDRGYDTFRQREIVPRDLAKLPAREQFTPRTSSVALALARAAETASGGAVRLSPTKVEHVIAGYTGGMGRAVSGMIDQAARADLPVIGRLDDRPAPAAQPTSQWSRFETQEIGFSGDDVETMFRRYEAAGQHLEQVRALARGGDRERAIDYAREHSQDLVMAQVLSKFVEGYRNLARARRAIENTRTLTPAQKRSRIAELGLLASQLARRALQAPISAPAR